MSSQMPNHNTHEAFNIAVLIIVVLYFYSWCDYTAFILLFTVGFLLCTFFITPDLDTDSRVYHRWKWLRLLWWPYKHMIKHRGISHNPILGPISLTWFMVIPALIYPSVWVVVSGMVIAIELHILTDKYL